MWGLNIWTCADETSFVQLKFCKMLLIVIERKFPLQFISFNCRFLQVRNVSFKIFTFDQQNFVKIQTVESYDVILTWWRNMSI